MQRLVFAQDFLDCFSIFFLLFTLLLQVFSGCTQEQSERNENYTPQIKKIPPAAARCMLVDIIVNAAKLLAKDDCLLLAVL